MIISKWYREILLSILEEEGYLIDGINFVEIIIEEMTIRIAYCLILAYENGIMILRIKIVSLVNYFGDDLEFH